MDPIGERLGVEARDKTEARPNDDNDDDDDGDEGGGISRWSLLVLGFCYLNVSLY